MNEHTAYTSAELMTINAARLLRDGDVVFVGVGLPNLACNLARRTHAPRLVMIYEAGVIGAQPARLPLSMVTRPWSAVPYRFAACTISLLCIYSAAILTLASWVVPK